MWRRLVWRGTARLVLIISLVAAMLIAGADRASAATLNVCVHGCPFSQLAPAVAAASNGDTITIGPGTYAGGVTVDVNVQIVGAGPRATIIKGGGVDADGLTTSVLTIGEVLASSEPTVSIRGVTITGGIAQTSPGSTAIFGLDGLWAAGGGIEVPPDASFVGATLTVSDSVITGNSVDPTASIDSGIPCPGFDGQCPFSPALGGGIDSWGSLTLDNSIVSDNTVGSAGTASDADGAGICSSAGSLTLNNTVVAGNRAVATAPNGRFAEGGGVNLGCLFGGGGGESLTVSNSVINDNSADYTNNFPTQFGGAVIGEGANAAGVDLEDGIPAAITNSFVTYNSATAIDPLGEPSGFDAAILASGPFSMANSVVSGNRSVTDAATSADVGPAGGIVEADGGGTITNTRITDNSSTMVSPNGVAAVNGALDLFNGAALLTVQNSTISDNTVSESTTTGSVHIGGVGITNDNPLSLVNDQVSDNSGSATGPAGTEQGGGIWNSDSLTGGPAQLSLQNTIVTRNTLSGGPGITREGAGLYTDVGTVTLTHSLIAKNVPDQCFGIAC